VVIPNVSGNGTVESVSNGITTMLIISRTIIWIKSLSKPAHRDTPQLIIIEYLSQLLLQRCRNLIRPDPLVNGPSSGQQSASVFLRGDTHSSYCNHKALSQTMPKTFLRGDRKLTFCKNT
jgi:hypothetical protein